MVASGVAQ